MRGIAFVGVDDAAELSLVVAAMFAILVLAALYLIVTLLGGIFRRIPFIGGPIADAMEAAANGLRTATLSVWHGLLWAADHLFHAFVALVQNMFTAARDVMEALERAIEHQAFVVVPREIRKLDGKLTTELRRAFQTAMQYTAHVEREAARWVRQAEADARAGDRRMARALTRLIDRTAAQLRHLIAQTRADARRWTDQAIARADHQFRQAEADAAAGDAATFHKSVAVALADADARAAQGAAEVWAGVETQLRRLEHVIGSDFPELLRLLQDTPAAAPAGLAAAVAAGMSFLPPILRTEADCVIPTCRDLGPMRNLAHILSAAATDAALLVWLIYCITEPDNAAHDTVTVINPLAGATMEPLINLLRII